MGKLVRDKIPGIIRADGGHPDIKILDDAAYLDALITKLSEESAEFALDHSVEELADIMEVVLALRKAIGVSADELEAVRSAKADKNGAFADKIYLNL